MQTYDPTQALDDLLHQLEVSMGAGYDDFLFYIQSCDNARGEEEFEHMTMTCES
jgi:hypothetical protein